MSGAYAALALSSAAEKQRDWELAGHDDAALAHVQALMSIADYPGDGHGQPRAGVQGADEAPNSALGGARSGNIAAELAQHAMLAILSRD